jgi:tryptophanyl-tRNA synthetase
MGEGARVMSLRDGSKKMSKSDPSDMSRINLNDDADTLAAKIRKARTDAEPLPAVASDLEGRPEAANLIGIYAALMDQSRDSVCAEYEGQGFAQFKKALTDVVAAKLAPITEEMARLQKEPDYIDGILAEGAEQASALAEPILAEVKKAVGYL